MRRIVNAVRRGTHGASTQYRNRPTLLEQNKSDRYCPGREISLTLTLVRQLWRSSTQCSAQLAQILGRDHRVDHELLFGKKLNTCPSTCWRTNSTIRYSCLIPGGLFWRPVLKKHVILTRAKCPGPEHHCARVKRLTRSTAAVFLNL